MQLLLINYIHKIQGLDKSLPICFALKEHLDVKIVSIIDFEEKTQVEQIGAFTELIEKGSDTIYYVNKNKKRFEKIGTIKKDIIRQAKGKYTDNYPALISYFLKKYDFKKFESSAKGIIGQDFFQESKPVLITIYNGVNQVAGASLASVVKLCDGVRIGYQKSIHDQGRGLTDLSKLSAKHTIHLKMEPYLDYFLVPKNSEYQSMLNSKGISIQKQIVAGYPICYPEWRTAILNTSYVKKFQKCRQPFEVVLFARGEATHKPKEDQIISDKWLFSAIDDIVEECGVVDPDFRLRIKPHPYQNVQALKERFSGYTKIELTWEPPSVLSATADLAVATYSSAILDSIAFNVPSIEYFHENETFKRNHPDGSPFGKFGAFIARNREQLHEAFSQYKIGKNNDYKLGDYLGNSLNIEYFEGFLR